MRLDVTTGEMALVQVDDLGARRGEDHDARHDEIAADVGRVLDPRPRVAEVLPGTEPEELPGIFAETEEPGTAAARETYTEGG
jgi:hypothetical protein